MTRNRRPLHHRHPLAAWALALALLLRALLPAGVMPDLSAAAEGRFDLVTCLGLRFDPPADGPTDGSADDRRGSVCDFAMVVVPDLPPAPAGLALPMALPAIDHPPALAAVAPVPARAGPPLGAHAPPLGPLSA
ncbi:hypothetical protein [Tistrella mobilis]|uniref:DUF2946 domain-containing protein n=1 Tax=Tistrella mobilis (strain KA081020-065) TaxID=1110502 RepID=I3TIW7_TISMK|nr:hypothetical protein [Tistrella mobilis]AFK52705.1 hypothetical protein TMO_0866 [Tistrella mobilis KA081020-065]